LPEGILLPLTSPPKKFRNKIKLISYGIPGINPKPKKLIHRGIYLLGV
jgi:hypothetical protein